MLPKSPAGHLGLGLFQFRIVGDPSPEAWSRAHRYASWMPGVELDGLFILGEGTLPKLRLNSPAGGWFPGLPYLTWSTAESTLSYVDLFISPHLKVISISIPWSWSRFGVPHDILPAIASTISALPASALQALYVDESHEARQVLQEHFQDSFSSIILRCGPSLEDFTSSITLSDAAINHLIQLPNLRTWRVDRPPPRYPVSSLPHVFPPLTSLTLGGGTAREWLSLIERFADRASATQGVTPLSRVNGSLESLSVEGLLNPIIDVSFASQIQMFRNLIVLQVDVEFYCGVDQCNFKLDNDNVAELAVSLSRLISLRLGHACSKNTCATTVACLLPLSVYCPKLKQLEIHFNTTNIADDLKNASADPRLQKLRSLPRCRLTYLDVWKTPLTLNEPGSLETVANGMVDIFPSLNQLQGFGGSTWGELGRKIAELRKRTGASSVSEALRLPFS